MARGLLRRWLLRGIATSAALGAALATVTAPVQAQPASAAALSIPDSAWSPPAEVDRTPSDGAPDRPWSAEGSDARTTSAGARVTRASTRES